MSCRCVFVHLFGKKKITKGGTRLIRRSEMLRKMEEFFFFVYYESIKREVKIRGMYECRCDERLQTKTKEFKRLAYTRVMTFAASRCVHHGKFRVLFVINR